LIKILLPTIVAFVVGILLTPLVAHQLYKHKMWKKTSGNTASYGDDNGTPIFNSLHKERDTNTPRMGGVIIWGSVLITTFLFWFFSAYLNPELNFFSKSQTLLPLLILMLGSVVGFLDDYFTVRGGGGHFAGGLALRQRFLVVGLAALLSGWWFYDKLGISSVSFLGFNNIELGFGFVFFYVFTALCIYMSSVIDGIDGLSGGVFMFIFAAYAGIALYQSQFDIAALCAAVAGSLLAFLWFNIPPARFYMTETGVMGLTMLLTVVAFMTDVLGEGEGVSVLPIIGFLLVVTVGTNAIQILSKKIRKKKVFLVAPLHHHFEAIGWPAYKVTMRYWILGFMFATTGIILAIAF